MAVTYTPTGNMDRLLDIWDQPPTPNLDGTPADAVPFALGVFGEITSLWSTTQASRLPQQVVTEVSHQIIILYMPGLKNRMFILYNDPDSKDDNGNVVPRRFNIDRILDPDEHKRELRILCIERNNGI